MTCPTKWTDAVHPETVHHCTQEDGLHEGPHRCSCGVWCARFLIGAEDKSGKYEPRRTR